MTINLISSHLIFFPMAKRSHPFITKALLILIVSAGSLRATEPSFAPIPENESSDQNLSTGDILFAPMLDDISIDDREGSEPHTGDSAKKGEWVIFPLPSRSPTMGWTVTVPATMLYRPSNVAQEAPAWATGAAAF